MNLTDQIQNQPLFPKWLNRAMELVSTGANAGTAYPEVWIRDLNTFTELGLQVGDPNRFRDAFLTFLLFQQPDGSIMDGYTPHSENPAYAYEFVRAPSCPDLDAHKNDVEADQETSLIQAVRVYVEITGDLRFLEQMVEGHTVRDRLARAMEFLYRERWSDSFGLFWNATTIDWGDVQPEHAWGVRMDENTHRACCIYTNAMAVIALQDLAWIDDCLNRDTTLWTERELSLKEQIDAHLWDSERKKYRPHLYLTGSPFPEDMQEERIHVHGGTGVAIQAGLHTPDTVRLLYQQIEQNRLEAGAQSVGLTIWPLYDVPESPNRVFHEKGHYQNGGDWPWFGGRIVLGLLQHGLMQEAYQALVPMLELAEKAGDFNEWHDLEGKAHGAYEFRGSAGVLGLAIQKLQNWACSGIDPST